MKTLQTNWWKILLIVLVSVVVEILSHIFWTPLLDYNYPASVIVEQDLYPLFATISITVIFAAMAIVFALIQDKLPGTKIAKGFWYGISFGLVWFVGILEMSLILGSPVIDEIRTSAADGSSILLMGLLLGMFTATDGSQQVRKSSRGGILSVLAVTIVYLVGRYLGYGVVGIMSTYSTKPMDTFIWTLGMGLAVGIMYWLLKDSSRGESARARAIWFGVVFFGIDWLFFNLFVLVFLKWPVTDLLTRAGVDILFVTASVWVVEAWSCSTEKVSTLKRIAA